MREILSGAKNGPFQRSRSFKIDMPTMSELTSDPVDTSVSDQRRGNIL